jgi:hypothetical protein
MQGGFPFYILSDSFAARTQPPTVKSASECKVLPFLGNWIVFFIDKQKALPYY